MKARSILLALNLLIPSVMVAQSSTNRPTRWILAYAGSAKGGIGVRYSTGDFIRLLAVVDSTGRATGWLHTGVICLSIWAPSGRAFSTWIGGSPAVGSDWDEYLDSLTTPHGILDRLDTAVTIISKSAAGPLGHAVPVILMVPYPDPDQPRLEFKARTYTTSQTVGRIEAAGAYVDAAKARFEARKFANLRLDGFYWLSESVKPTDTAVVKGVGGKIHEAGLRFVWVPYFFASSMDSWRHLGFDEAWLQPNFFFHPDVAQTRLDSAVQHATALGLGMEIEFNSKIRSDPAYYDRLGPYLAAFEETPTLRQRSIVTFDGEGALVALSASTNQRDRAIYHRLVSILSGNDSTATQ